MDVILLTDVEKVGLRGEVVNVARGYTRNFLLPRRLAEPATPAKVAELAGATSERARHEARDARAGAGDRRDARARPCCASRSRPGPTGALFGSVTPTDIADELWRTRKVRVDRRKIELDEPIKRIGRYEVPIEVFQDVRVEVKTLVVPEGGELPPEEELEAMEAAEARPRRAEADAQPRSRSTAEAQRVAPRSDEPRARDDRRRRHAPSRADREPTAETASPPSRDASVDDSSTGLATACGHRPNFPLASGEFLVHSFRPMPLANMARPFPCTARPIASVETRHLSDRYSWPDPSAG